MMISASPPLGIPNRDQNGDLSSQTNSANPSSDFSALLFLILATLQVQNTYAQTPAPANSIEPALGEPKEASPPVVAIGQEELNTLAPENMTLARDPGQSVAVGLKASSQINGAQDQKIANDLADNDKITLAAPTADDSPTMEFAVRQAPTKEALVTKNGAVSLSAQAIHPAAADVEVDKGLNIFGGMENRGSEKIDGNFQTVVQASKAPGTQDQNLASAFDGHGEKTSSEAHESNHDHPAQTPNASAILPSISMHNAESLKSGDLKSAPPWSPVINQVAGGIAANVRQSKHEAVITLDPPELGSLKINLSLDGGKVEVHIIAEAHESRNLIENHLPELRQALQLHRLDLVDVRVDSGSWNATTGDLTHGFQQEPHGRQEWGWNFESPLQTASEPAETQRPNAASPATGRVSMWA